MTVTLAPGRAPFQSYGGARRGSRTLGFQGGSWWITTNGEREYAVVPAERQILEGAWVGDGLIARLSGGAIVRWASPEAAPELLGLSSAKPTEARTTLGLDAFFAVVDGQPTIFDRNGATEVALPLPMGWLVEGVALPHGLFVLRAGGEVWWVDGERSRRMDLPAPVGFLVPTGDGAAEARLAVAGSRRSYRLTADGASPMAPGPVWDDDDEPRLARPPLVVGRYLVEQTGTSVRVRERRSGRSVSTAETASGCRSFRPWPPRRAIAVCTDGVVIVDEHGQLRRIATSLFDLDSSVVPESDGDRVAIRGRCRGGGPAPGAGVMSRKWCIHHLDWISTEETTLPADADGLVGFARDRLFASARSPSRLLAVALDGRPIGSWRLPDQGSSAERVAVAGGRLVVATSRSVMHYDARTFVGATLADLAPLETPSVHGRVAFADDRHGLFIATQAPLEAHRTGDGGRTWAPVPLPVVGPGELQPVFTEGPLLCGPLGCSLGDRLHTEGWGPAATGSPQVYAPPVAEAHGDFAVECRGTLEGDAVPTPVRRPARLERTEHGVVIHWSGVDERGAFAAKTAPTRAPMATLGAHGVVAAGREVIWLEVCEGLTSCKLYFARADGVLRSVGPGEPTLPVRPHWAPFEREALVSTTDDDTGATRIIHLDNRGNATVRRELAALLPLHFDADAGAMVLASGSSLFSLATSAAAEPELVASLEAVTAPCEEAGRPWAFALPLLFPRRERDDGLDAVQSVLVRAAKPSAGEPACGSALVVTTDEGAHVLEPDPDLGPRGGWSGSGLECWTEPWSLPDRRVEPADGL